MEGVIVFVTVLVAGLLVMAASRGEWADELSRLGKHSRRLAEKNNEDEQVNIFLTQRNDYLSRLLSMAGLESKYDQISLIYNQRLILSYIRVNPLSVKVG